MKVYLVCFRHGKSLVLAEWIKEGEVIGNDARELRGWDGPIL